MATQQEIDTQTGLHNTSGYDQSGNRIAGGQVDNYGTPTNQAITPNSLQQNTPVQPTVAQPVANPTVPDFLQVNQQEQQATDQYAGVSSAIASLTGELAGRDAYTTGQSAQQDVIGKQANVTNYQQQLKALQQEQSGISLQREQNIQAKQQAMSGQGIASGIVNRHSAIDTQYNQQTLTNAIKQYSVGAQLSAAQGDLTSALNYVDQAVKLKYQPIEAQITAQQANLQAIQNSPNFTSAQKKQAAAQQLQLQQYTQQIADEKKAYQDTQDAIIKTVTNNPNITPQQNAAISAAQSPSEVAQLVNYFGLSSISKSDQLDQTLKQAQIDKANYDLAHPNRQTQVIEANDGHTLLIDTNTGATIKDYGVKKAVVDTKAPEIKTIGGVEKQWNPNTQKWEDIAGVATTPEQTKKSEAQIDLVLNSLSNAEKLAGAAGRSGLRKGAENLLVGSTDFTNLVAETNTLRTNVLTMMTDPAIKKFFGPQMSNADVQLMTSAGTTLNPELQDPKSLKAELARLKDFATRAKEAVQGATKAPTQQVEYQGKIYNVDANGDMTPA